RVTEPSAHAWVHRGDELERGGKQHRAGAPRDGDPTLLERLAERLQDVTAELGKLVEEEDAVVGERDFARPDGTAAAEEGRVRERAVRRPDRPCADEWVAVEQARDAVDGGHLDRLVDGEGREDGGQATREHGLARAGGPDQQQVVAPGGGHLERALGVLLAA